MNIFYLDRDPQKAAEFQYNKHVVKMILESAQMLSTAHRILVGDHYIDASSGRRIQRWKLNNPHMENVLYKAAHVNHPSNLWVRQNKNNYFWLYEHMVALGKQFTERYDKIHLSIKKCLKPLSLAPKGISNEPFNQPPQCMPEEYKDKCSIKAYWNYYIGEKHSVAGKKEKIYR